MKATSVCAWFVAAAFAGCTGTGDVEYAGEVHVASPDLVTIQPGVQVVADADQPLFYVEGNYYLYRDGYWLRSDSYRGGFARIEHVPGRLRVIDQPQAFVHYRSHQGSAIAITTTIATMMTEHEDQLAVGSRFAMRCASSASCWSFGSKHTCMSQSVAQTG